MPIEGTRPPVHSPEFRPYFEGVINSSNNVTEAMRRMGYTDRSSVRYHMKRFGIRPPNHWRPGPSPVPQLAALSPSLLRRYSQFEQGIA